MNHPGLQLKIPSGAPAVAIPREHHMLVASILQNLRVVNGRLMINNDQWTLVCNRGGFPVKGTPGLFKSPQLLGYVKADITSDWVLLSIAEMVEDPPTQLYTSFVVGVNSFPWRGLIPTWDYVRAHQ